METSIKSRSSDSSYRPDIDGLRAIAVLSVVIYHAGIPFLKGGFVGVDIFFVISGYLIGAHVYSDIRRGRFSIPAFYRKRAKRILPALLVVLTFCYLVAVLILSPQELKLFGSYSIATILSWSNVLAWLKSDYFAPDANQNPLLMTWSLGVEEQFYVIFPILMLLFAKARHRNIFLGTLLVTIVSLAACIVETPKNPSAVFYLLPTRAWEIAFGVLLAVYEKGRPSGSLYFAQRFRHIASTVGILLIAIGIFFFDLHTPFPGSAALLPVCGAACIISAPAGWANRILSTTPFIFIGQISYSLYLWHWPLLSFSRIIADRPISIAMGCTIAAVSFVCAWLSYRFVEQPCRKSKVLTRPLLIRYAILCAIVILPAVLFRYSSGLPNRFPKLIPIEADRYWELDKCPSGDSLNLSRACVDTQDPRPAIALLGDSHAQAISTALRKIANQSGFKMYEIVEFACPPLTGVIIQYQPEDNRRCIDHNAQALSFLEHDPRVRVVVLVGYWAGPEVQHLHYVPVDHPDSSPEIAESRRNLGLGLGATVSSLKSANKEVILLQDVPIFTFDPLRRIRSMYIPARTWLARHLFPSPETQGRASLSETYREQDEAAADVINSVAAQYNVSIFDPKKNLCSNDCLFFRDQRPLFWDEEHVTPVGGEVALAGLTFTSDHTPRSSSTVP